MAIYELTSSTIRPIVQTTFRQVAIRERGDLQRILREHIEVVSPDTLIIAEEFGEWDDSRRRIDLLGLDLQGNLVVIELKRTEDGGHMELQALRYAAMVSTMTFRQVVDAHGRYLASQDEEDDPEDRILQFLDWDEPNEELFAQDVRIVLASAEFSKELLTSVMWLSDRGHDIRCVRMRPHADGDRVLLDVQQVLPLPEAEEYQIKVRDKTQSERASRQSSRDYTKYDVRTGDDVYEALSKREAVFRIVKHLCETGVTPEQINQRASFRRTNWSRSVEGEIRNEQLFIERAASESREQGRAFDKTRYYTGSDELITWDGRTYAVSNQWGRRAIEWVRSLLETIPDHDVTIQPTAS